jgi:hypothetical protein
MTNKKEKPKIEIVPLDRFYLQPGATDIEKEPVIERLRYYYSDLEKKQSINQGLVRAQLFE